MQRKQSINTWKEWEEKYINDRKLATETLADAWRFIRVKSFVITCLAMAIAFMGLAIGFLNKIKTK